MFPPKRPSNFADAFEPDIAGTRAPETEEPVEEAGGDTVCPTCGASCAKIEAAAGKKPAGGMMEMGGMK